MLKYISLKYKKFKWIKTTTFRGMNEKFRHEDEKQKKVTIEKLKSTQKRSNTIIEAHLDI